MGNEELMVTISVKRFEELVAIEAGAKIIKAMAINAKYGSVAKEDVALALAFELPIKETKEEIF